MAEAAGLAGSSPLAASRPASRAAAFHPSDVMEKYKGLILRCQAWLQGEARRQKDVSPEGAQRPTPPTTMMRYYAIADDTFHPEVREGSDPWGGINDTASSSSSHLMPHTCLRG